MKLATLIVPLLAACVSAAQPQPTAPKFDGARAFADLKAMVELLYTKWEALAKGKEEVESAAV